MSEFKKCENGHYYQGVSCPYCPSTSKETTKTVANNEAGNTPTVVDNGKTEVLNGINTFSEQTKSRSKVNDPNDGRTVFGDDVKIETSSGEIKIEKEYRSSRMLVGWLVTYSHDKMGNDYKLYEGRNVIGRDISCNITVNDKTMTGKHAVLLFKNGSYKIKDEMSTHGTLVNGVDIEDEHYTLKDGDTIKLGETTFKFRTSL